MPVAVLVCYTPRPAVGPQESASFANRLVSNGGRLGELISLLLNALAFFLDWMINALAESPCVGARLLRLATRIIELYQGTGLQGALPHLLLAMRRLQEAADAVRTAGSSP